MDKLIDFDVQYIDKPNTKFFDATLLSAGTHAELTFVYQHRGDMVFMCENGLKVYDLAHAKALLKMQVQERLETSQKSVRHFFMCKPGATMQDLEIEYIKPFVELVLDMHKGNVTASAVSLGMNRATLDKRLKEWGIK